MKFYCSFGDGGDIERRIPIDIYQIILEQSSSYLNSALNDLKISIWNIEIDNLNVFDLIGMLCNSTDALRINFIVTIDSNFLDVLEIEKSHKHLVLKFG